MVELAKTLTDLINFISSPQYIAGAISGACAIFFPKWLDFYFSKKASRLEARRAIIKNWRHEFSLLAFKNHNLLNGRRGSAVILPPQIISIEAEHECGHYIHYVTHHKLYSQLEAISSNYFNKTLHERLKNRDKSNIRRKIDFEKLVFTEISRIARKWGIE